MSVDRAIASFGKTIAFSMGCPLIFWAGAGWAQATSSPDMPPGLGQPAPWQIGMQGSASAVMDQTRNFYNDLLFPIITGIVLFVFVLLAYVILRFNKRANPIPSKVTHNTAIEIVWTVLPILILVVIAVPSFRLLYQQMTIPKADLTLKVTGSRFAWSYEYPDNGGIELSSVQMVEDVDLKPGQPRLLTADAEAVVPVNKVVRLQATSSDVIHSFALPSLAVKLDAVPGRLNESWFSANREGIYYGQCSELCGQKHAFMPINIRVVSEDEFNRWVASKKAAMNGETTTKVASSLQPIN